MSACRPFVGAWMHALVALVSCAPIAAQELFAELGKGGATLRSPDYESVLHFVGDLDGDGDPDALVTDAERGEVALHWNDGHGRFARATPLQFPPGLQNRGRVLGADFDRDGDLDLLLTGDDGHPSSPPRFLRNTGGVFVDATASRIPAGSSLGRVTDVGDLDRDGDLDVITWNSGLQAWINRDPLPFAPTAIAMPVPAPFVTVPSELLAGDLDGDGFVDLILAHVFGQNHYLLGRSNLTFVDGTARAITNANHRPQSLLRLQDVDRDGDLDLLSAQCWGAARGAVGAAVLLNDGTASFSIPVGGELPAMGNVENRPVAGDFDGDGVLDLFVSYATWSSLYRRDRAGAFHEFASTDFGSVSDAFAVDVDGDGDDDVVHAGATGAPQVLSFDPANGLGSTGSVRLTVPRLHDVYYPGHHAFGDLDGDGAAEHVYARLDQLSVTANDGDGWFRSRTSLPVPDLRGGVVVAADVTIVDYDGDGHRDVVLARCAASADYVVPILYLYRNDGTGRVVVPPAALDEPRGSVRTAQLVPADLDGDGDVDFAAALDGMLHVLEQIPDGRLVQATHEWFRTPQTARGLVLAGDVDADGDIDLLVLDSLPTEPSLRASRLLRNDGALGFTDVSASLQGLDAVQAALGDVDGDGDLDVVADRARTLVLLRNTGGTNFVVEPVALVPPGTETTQPKALADLDEDGDLDLALASDGIYANDGTGAFARRSMPAEEIARPGGNGVPEQLAELVLSDLDRDGDLDLFRTFGWPERVAVNLLRQIHAPYAPRVGRPFRVEVYARHGAASANDFAVVMLAASGAEIPLPGIGVLRVDPASLVAMPPLALPQPEGQVAVDLAIPNATSLLGLEVHAQAVVFQARTRIALTNATVDVVER